LKEKHNTDLNKIIFVYLYLCTILYMCKYILYFICGLIVD